jgi:hypothetical protein
LIDAAVRCRDPWVRAQGGWVCRRLAPDCSRVELSSLSKAADATRLLTAMGRETANIHLNAPKAAKEILADLKDRKPKWLRAAADDMIASLEEDWTKWKETQAG